MIDNAAAGQRTSGFVCEFRATRASDVIWPHLASIGSWRPSRIARRSTQQDDWFSEGRPGQDGVLSTGLVGRLYAILFIISGLVTAVSPLLPAPSTVNRSGVVAVGLVALTAGMIVWNLPWYRWRRSVSLTLIPVAFVMIAVHNYFGGSDPYRFGLFFMVAFVGLGIAHPQWTCLKMSPLFVIAYLAPFFATRPFPLDSASSVIYAVPTCLLVGESLSWVGGRLQKAQQALWRNEARFRSLVQNASDIVLVVDAEANLEYLSPSALRRLRGADTRMARGLSLDLWVHPDDLGVLHRLIASCMRSPMSTSQAEFRYRDNNQSWRYVEAIASNLIDEPSVRGVVITARDIQDRKSLEAELAHQAFHDPLTGLANRALLTDRLTHALSRLTVRGGNVAVLFLDLDQFKVINDSLGHNVGDELLASLAERLRRCVRPGDTIARMGGDEFTLLLEDVEGVNQAIAVATRIHAEMVAPFELSGHEVFATCSVGVALSGEREQKDAVQLLRSADVAMYQAKAQGVGRTEVFEATMDDGAHRRLELEQGLRWALDRREFEIHYQSFVSLVANKEVGREALVRWRHPRRGLIAPSTFITVAEETGLIVPLGKWVLSESCRAARAWSMIDPDSAPIVSVNLSTRQLLDPGLLDNVAQIINETEHDPSSLVLEITETSVMVESAAVLSTLHALKRLGVRLAIDDFGTGYSSLSYLKTLPVDLVKIDRSFVTDIQHQSQDAAIVGAIVDVAHSLGLQVVAEGVESVDQLTTLRALGCDVAQGYYFGEPAPIDHSVAARHDG